MEGEKALDKSNLKMFLLILFQIRRLFDFTVDLRERRLAWIACPRWTARESNDGVPPMNSRKFRDVGVEE
ncbi:hypothetical protein HZH66_006537 [Vespula vulgaris]|uniref:Uncharacterized protein n=1 Tax=Vespula vulgaris TaxID=7454 RepID=A0A834N6I0_VESVU|nr:hypothetical protein HZH66_006537 [Vespula vulgaris]